MPASRAMLVILLLQGVFQYTITLGPKSTPFPEQLAKYLAPHFAGANREGSGLTTRVRETGGIS